MSDPNQNGNHDNPDIRLFESGDLADATIVCGDRTWKVHKLILSSRCKWFKTAFYGKLAEAASGKVVLQEQDPDLIDALLHFIYAQDLDIAKLRDGKDVPLLCIQVFRLGDFFLLDALKAKATAQLQAHFDITLVSLKNKTTGAQTPQWLTEILDAVQDAYRDKSTAPIIETLLKFMFINNYKIFQFKDAMALLDKFPDFCKDFTKTCIINASARCQQRNPRAGLKVLASVQAPRHPADKKRSASSCLLYPVMEGFTFVFIALDNTTDRNPASLAWMTPDANKVETLTTCPNGEIVVVGISGSSTNLFLRFSNRSDAKFYVERYCLANPRIDVVANDSGRLTRAMISAQAH